MRDLECMFDRQNNDKLMCTWNEPEHPNGRVRYYHVRLSGKREIIYDNETPDKHFELNHNLEDGETYVVGVNAKANSWSETTSTTFRYMESSELTLLFKPKSLHRFD